MLDTLRGSSQAPVFSSAAPVDARAIGVVAVIAVTVGGIAAYVLYGAGEVDEAVDWGELGLAWLLPTLVVGGLGMWVLSRRATSASSREGGPAVSGSSSSDLSGAALGSPGVDPSTRR
jgi:hypothetical protein